MQNVFESVYLDFEKSQLLTSYLLKNKYITEYYDGEKIDYPETFNSKLIGIKKLFIILTLYDNIDFQPFTYKYSSLYDMGILKKRILCKYGANEIKTALNIMSISTKKLHAYYQKIVSIINYSNFKNYLLNIYIPAVINNLHESVVNILEKTFNDIQMNEKITEAKANLLIFLYQIMINLADGLAFSSNFYTEIFQCDKMKNTKIFENINYICKIKLPSEINILPAPQTLSDVIAFRKSPYIRSFRNVFSEWMQCIQEGNINMANKMKNDVIKANSYFEKLEKYHKYSTNPFVRTCVFIGGFIPIISEMLNVSTYVGGIIEDYLTEKNNWVLISNGR